MKLDSFRDDILRGLFYLLFENQFRRKYKGTIQGLQIFSCTLVKRGWSTRLGVRSLNDFFLRSKNIDNINPDKLKTVAKPMTTLKDCCMFCNEGSCCWTMSVCSLESSDEGLSWSTDIEAVKSGGIQRSSIASYEFCSTQNQVVGKAFRMLLQISSYRTLLWERMKHSSTHVVGSEYHVRQTMLEDELLLGE